MSCWLLCSPAFAGPTLLPTGASLPSWLGAAAIYLAIGVAVGLLLSQAGRSRATALSALACWPLMLSLLGAPVRPAVKGPLARNIAHSFDALAELLRDEAAGDPATAADWSAPLQALRRDLERADRRLAVADRILAEQPRYGTATLGQDLRSLQHARDRAATELEAVLAGVHQLRIQVGLLALSEIRGGPALAVQRRLGELRARVKAIEELSQLEAPSAPPAQEAAP